ncbi:MAG TPA: hypothetical protein VIL38_05970 [Thermaerobacter sp.]
MRKGWLRKGGWVAIGLVLVLGLYGVVFAAGGPSGNTPPGGGASGGMTDLHAAHHGAMMAAMPAAMPAMGQAMMDPAAMEAMHQSMMNMSFDDMVRLCQAHHGQAVKDGAGAAK